MKTSILFQATLVISLLLFNHGCTNNPAEEAEIVPQNNLIADTIIYDVLIKNPNPEDTWTTECIDNLKKAQFIDQIFAAIYNGNLEPMEYYDDTPLKIRKIRNQEKAEELIRSNIGKVQFTERWYYDPREFTMKKEVISLVFGQQLYNNEGEVRGYKPVFKVNLK
jgi:hypothetical protein